MSIWNTGAGASPNVGFAIQNQLGTGITVRPVDPRLFGGGQGSTTGASRSSKGSSGTSGSDNKSKALVGTKRDIIKRENAINNAIENLKTSYIEKMLDKSLDEKGRDALNKEYNTHLSALLEEQMDIPVLNIAGELEHKKWERGNVAMEGVEQELAFKTNLVGGATTGQELLNTFHQERGLYNNPFYIVKDGKDFRLGTKADYQNDANNLSGIEEDGNVTQYQPSSPMSTSNQFDTEVRQFLASAGNEELYQYFGPEGEFTDRMGVSVLNAMMSEGGFVTSLNTNERNLLNAATNMFNNISEDSRAFAISKALRTGVLYNRTTATGVKVETLHKREDGSVMTPEEVMEYNIAHPENKLEVEHDDIDRISGIDAVFYMDKYNRLAIQAHQSNDAQERMKGDEYQKLSKMYADGIINTAKQLVVMTALGRQSALANYTSSVTKKIDEFGGEKQPKEATFVEAFVAKGQYKQQNMYRHKDDIDGSVMQDIPGSKAIDINLSDKKEFLQRLFGVDTEKELRENEMTMPSLGNQFLMNGVVIRAGAMYENSSEPDDFKVIGIGSTAYNLPQYDITPRGDYMVDPMTHEDGTSINTLYIPIRVRVPYDAKIPVQTGSNEVKMINARTVARNPKAYPTLKIITVDNLFLKDLYTLDILIPAIDMYSTVDARDKSANYNVGKNVNEYNVNSALQGRQAQEAIKSAAYKKIYEPSSTEEPEDEGLPKDENPQERYLM